MWAAIALAAVLSPDGRPSAVLTADGGLASAPTDGGPAQGAHVPAHLVRGHGERRPDAGWGLELADGDLVAVEDSRQRWGLT